MTGIRIEVLDDGYLVVDARGPQTWRAAAVTLADAEALARHRASPRIPSPPPGRCLENSGYAESFDPPEHPRAALQYAQATEDTPCIGGVCSMD